MRIEGSPFEGGTTVRPHSLLLIVASCSLMAEPDAAMLTTICSPYYCCSWLQYLDPAASLLEANDIASVEYFFALGEEARKRFAPHGLMMHATCTSTSGCRSHWQHKKCHGALFDNVLVDVNNLLDPGHNGENDPCAFALQSEQKLKSEAEEHGDMLFLAAPEGYQNLWRKTIVFLEWANSRRRQPEEESKLQSSSLTSSGTNDNSATRRYFMHVDDDSFVRLDLLLPELVGCDIILSDCARR